MLSKWASEDDEQRRCAPRRSSKPEVETSRRYRRYEGVLSSVEGNLNLPRRSQPTQRVSASIMVCPRSLMDGKVGACSDYDLRKEAVSEFLKVLHHAEDASFLVDRSQVKPTTVNVPPVIQPAIINREVEKQPDSGRADPANDLARRLEAIVLSIHYRVSESDPNPYSATTTVPPVPSQSRVRILEGDPTQEINLLFPVGIGPSLVALSSAGRYDC
jgi:hypothetical protein